MKKYKRNYSTIEPAKLVELFDQLPKNPDNSVNTRDFIKLIQQEARCSLPTAYKLLHYQDGCFVFSWGKAKLFDSSKVKSEQLKGLDFDITKNYTTLHKQKIKEVLDCLDIAIPIDSIRPDILGFCFTELPSFIYAVEIGTGKLELKKLKNYEKQNAVKYVIFVSLLYRITQVVSLSNKEKPLPNYILEVVKKIENKLFGVQNNI